MVKKMNKRILPKPTQKLKVVDFRDMTMKNRTKVGTCLSLYKLHVKMSSLMEKTSTLHYDYAIISKHPHYITRTSLLYFQH
jgi:hypothetical protein